jgi:hypothetical protein
VSALIPPPALPDAAATVVVSFGVAAVFLYVGYRIAQRPVSPAARLASYQLAFWWAGVGVSVALSGIELLLAALNAFPFALALTTYLVQILLDCAFLWALVGFLLYVYTGKYRLAPLTAFYLWFYVTVLYYFFSQDPYAIHFVADQAIFLYSGTTVPALELAVILGLLGPELIGAVLYLSLLRRTRVPAQRYRITLVGGGILLWLALDLFVPVSTPAWLLARTILQLIPGFMSLIAFDPPEWARRRYRIPLFPGPSTERPELTLDP